MTAGSLAETYAWCLEFEKAQELLDEYYPIAREKFGDGDENTVMLQSLSNMLRPFLELHR
jgi:hypothetical protein